VIGDALALVLPGLPPSVNAAYQHTAGGGKQRRPAVQAWEAQMSLVIRNAATLTGWTLPARTPFVLTVELHAARLYGFDLDNCLKILQDTVVRTLGLDDRYIVGLYVTKHRAADPHTRVRLTPFIGLPTGEHAL
jgi:Holliday junction resolvase RusA-like endonuclease